MTEDWKDGLKNIKLWISDNCIDDYAKIEAFISDLLEVQHVEDTNLMKAMHEADPYLKKRLEEQKQAIIAEVEQYRDDIQDDPSTLGPVIDLIKKL